MKQEVIIDNKAVVLETNKIYTGVENPSEEEKAIRKALGLPLKKQLVYYGDKCDKDTIIAVKEYWIEEIYDITSRWYAISITTSKGDTKKMHSAYFAEMQKPSFVSEKH